MSDDGAQSVTHRSSFATLSRLWPYVRPVRLELLASLAAALGAMLAGLSIPLVIQQIIDGPVARGELSELPWLVGLVLVLGVAEAVLFYARRRLNVRPSTTVEMRLREDIYHQLQRLPVAFHDKWQSGQLLSRAVNDLSTLRRFIAFAAIFLVVNATVLVVGVGVLLTLSPLLGLVVIACGAPLVVLSYLFETKYKIYARRAQDLQGDLASTVEESVLGIRVLKAFGRGRNMTKSFMAQARSLRGAELSKVRVMAALWAVLVSLPELAIAGQLAIGGIGIANGTLTAGTLVAAITVATYLRWPFDSIGWLLAETNMAASACDRYWEVRDEINPLVEPEHPRELPEHVHGYLRFEDVHFAYDGGQHEVLKGIDLEVRPGETVALVGSTGSGKTALTALVARLADVTGGRVTVDGIDVRDLRMNDLRQIVATAFEEPVLFSASVRENVALGTPDATDEDVHEALRVAQAEEFVAKLPWGIATRVGEQGLSLSGGQRQRLALARAVVGRPAVLVLDDPLSALDVHTEGEVERALRRVLHDVTALVVAHRPSTVQLADRVAMLVDGRIAAVGTHSELIATNAEYRRLLSTLDEDEDEEVAV
ncbi:ABC transporter ATP-binding protein [Kutzneria sp. 744]|uniref:ABC transporter ATP-binding protein n=1 Tax=Kutzneria sp. (strain 744) TaxID=345341 RepID=UPI0003EED017|nr:ABC transporter ATP-binding protein [Kutzneria sp. 744]EWM14286.1 ABC transporter [Kutzneria sp. 744]